MLTGAEIRAEGCADASDLTAEHTSRIAQLHETALATVTVRFQAPGPRSAADAGAS